MKKILIAVILSLFVCSIALAIDFSGTYTLNSGGATLTLVLKQDAQGKIRGKLSSSNGESYTLNGKVEGENAEGTCSNGVFFTARFRGDQLMLKLMDRGPDGNPNPDTAKKLILTRQGGATAPEPTVRPAPTTPAMKPKKPGPAAPVQEDTVTSAPAQLSGEEIGDPAWGFKFRAPRGWTHQQNADAAALKHSTIAGVILIFPHQQPNMQQLQADMQNGITEEQVQLRLEGQLKKTGNIISGNYVGLYQGQRVRARGIGALSPYGGGAIIIALASGDQFTPGLSGAADTIAGGIKYIKTDTGGGSGGGGETGGNLAAYFAGTWSKVSATVTKRITLSPNGDYNDYSESTSSGQFRNQYGDNTGSWGTGSQNQKKGRWTVRGTREKGTLTVTYPNGEKFTCEYHVHVEKGKTYWSEYYFCNELYAK